MRTCCLRLSVSAFLYGLVCLAFSAPVAAQSTGTPPKEATSSPSKKNNLPELRTREKPSGTPAPALSDVPQASASVKELPPEELSFWVQKLDSDSYSERKTAMQKLRQSGPTGVTALVQAARSQNPEVSVRAICLLTELYQSAHPDVAIAADDALESLGESGPPMAVVRTQEALSSTLAPLRRRHAIAAIKRLGGHVIPTRELDDEGLHEVEADLNKEGTVQHIVLGKKWTGGLAGIKYLQRLPELRTLYITTAIPLSPDEQTLLKQKLSSLRVEYRGSAFLGIKSLIQDPEICIIDSVVQDSPAQRGGLLKDDIITHLDGLRVYGFTDLTDGLKVKQGGDTVYLDILRGDEPLEVSVILGEW